MAALDTIMKAMGVSPEKLMEQFSGQIRAVQEYLQGEFDALNDRMEAMEKRLEAIETEIQKLPDVHLVPPHHAAEMGVKESLNG